MQTKQILHNSPTTPKSEFLAGVKAELPIIIGVLPFGLIYGVLGVSNGISNLETQMMSSIIFAGSAQFIAAGLMGSNTPVVVMWATTFIVNLRHLLYSADLAPHVRHLNRRWRWLLAYLLTDEAYAPTTIHYQSGDKKYKHFFWLGAGSTLWASWQLSTAIGIIFGAQVPASWGLDLTLSLTFIGMVIPTLKDRPAVAAAIVAGLVATVAFPLPYKLNIMLAAFAGIATGVLLEGWGRTEGAS